MTRTTLLALAERVEAATATEQHEMLEAAFVAVHGPKPERVHGGSPEWHAWLDLHNPFFRKLAAEAYESAAMSLVPSGHEWAVNWCGNSVANVNEIGVNYPVYCGGASTPALALTAAACRAIAGSMTDD